MYGISPISYYLTNQFHLQWKKKAYIAINLEVGRGLLADGQAYRGAGTIRQTPPELPKMLFSILLSSLTSFFDLMRLSVASVVSFQGLFGVEVKTYKVLAKNTSRPTGAGKIFCQTVRLDLVRPLSPRKHLCT